MRLRLVSLLIAGSLVVGSWAGWSGTAGAAAYTLSSSVAFNNVATGVSGTINPVTDLSGTSICLNNTCGNTSTQDWFVVTVTLNGSSNDVDEIGIGVVGETAVGGGHFSDPDATPLGGSIVGGAELIDYDHPNVSASNLQNGATSDRLFAVFGLGQLPGDGLMPGPDALDHTASFMISRAGGTNFSIQGNVVLVPEPATGLMLGAGLAGLAIASRRRTRGR